MSYKSFIVNPEINVVISIKDLPAKFKTNEGKSSRSSVTAQVKFTERELDILKKVDKLEADKKSTNLNSKKASLKKEKTTSLTLPQLKQLKKDIGDSAFLCDFVDSAELRLPENEIVERNPVLEKRIQRLKAEQEQRVYNSMTKNVDNSRKYMPEETISFQLKQINRQLIAVLQFVFSVISGFFFGFLGIELMIGPLDFGFRLLLGIICALVIALAEIYFLAKKLNEEMPVEESPVKMPGDKIKTN